MHVLAKFRSGGVLLTFFMLWLCSNGLWGKKVTTVDFSSLGYNNGEAVKTFIADDVTFGLGGGSGTLSAYYDDGAALRLYKGNELAISVPGTILEVAFTYSGNYKPSSNPAETGTYSNDTWTGSAQDSIVFTNPKDGDTWYIQEIRVAYLVTKTLNPVLTPADGERFMGQLTVHATCATDGAVIYYTTDGSNPTPSSETFPAGGLTITQTTTIKAMAAVAGGDLENSDVVEATYTRMVVGTDELTSESFEASGGTYAEFSGVEGTSGAVYAGMSAASYDAIQLRTTDSNSGIVTTQSGGERVETILVEWNSNTSTQRVLEIYGKTSAYSNATDLYGSKQGTKIGELACGETTLEVTGDYPYIGIRSEDGALYLDKLTIIWDTGASSQVVTPVLTPAQSFMDELMVIATCETEGATIHYTTNGDVPTADSPEFPAAGLSVSETTTVKAIAVMADGSLANSEVVTATYTKLEIVASLEELKANGAGEYLVQLDNAVVTYVDADRAYVQDKTAGVLLYGNCGYQAGTSLNGTAQVRLEQAGGQCRIVMDGSDFSDVEAAGGAEIPVVEVSLEELANDFARYESMRVSVKEVTVVSAISNRLGEIAQGGTTMALYDLADKGIQADAQAVLDIVGYPGLENEMQCLNVLVQEDITVIQEGKLTATLSFASETYGVNVGETTFVKATANYETAQITYASSNPDIAMVDAATGEVTGVEAGTTTITASVAETDDYTAATASCTITVTGQAASTLGVAFVAERNGNNYAMKNEERSGNKLWGQEVEVVNGKVVVTGDEDISSISWIVNEERGTIRDAEGYYVAYSGSSTNIELQSSSYRWTVVDNMWTIDDQDRALGINDSYGTEYYFGAYEMSSSGYGKAQIMSIVNGYGRNGLEANNYYGTICLPYAVAAGDFIGAEFFSIAGKVKGTDGKVQAIVLEQQDELEAGVPYIFSATSEELMVAYSGVATGRAKSVNGLVGSFGGQDVAEGMYLISDENKVQLCGEGCRIGSNRAYIDMAQVPEYVATAGANVHMLWFEGATGIGDVETEDVNRLVDVYTLGGVKVRGQIRAAEATRGLQSGIYVIDGKKVAVE